MPSGIRPNFLLIGAAKCGTTTLCHHLSNHPDVFLAPRRDAHFFLDDDRHRRGWEWYEKLFAEHRGERAIGENSNHYARPTLDPGMVNRVVDGLDHPKLILIVRNPLRRIESSWTHMHDEGTVRGDINDVVRRGKPDLVGGSLYWLNYQLWLRRARPSDLHVLFFEDFIRDTQEHMRAVYRFLDVHDDVPLVDPSRPRNSTNARARDRTLTRILRATPLKYVARAAGPRLRRSLKPLFRRRMATRVVWEDAVLEGVVDRVREDASQFLRHFGKPEEYWPLP